MAKDRYQIFQDLKKDSINKLVECSKVGKNLILDEGVAFQYMGWLADEFVSRLLPSKIESLKRIYEFLSANGYNSKKQRMGEMHGDRYAYLIPSNRKDLKAFHYEDQNCEYLYILQERFSSVKVHIRKIKSDKDFAKLLKNDFASYALPRGAGNPEPKYEACAEMFRYGDCRDEGYILSGETTFSYEFIEAIMKDKGESLTPKELQTLKEASEARVERSFIDFYAVQHTFADIDGMIYYVEKPDELE